MARSKGTDTFLNPGNKRRASILLSPEAIERLNALSDKYHMFKYDVIGMLAEIAIEDDPRFQGLIKDNLDKLPLSAQRYFKNKYIQEGSFPK